MKRILGMLAGCLLFGALLAQQGKISISVVSEQHLALENSTVELLKPSDSSLVKVAITDDEGHAEFENIAFGTYLLRVTLVNYLSQYAGPLELAAAQSTVSWPPVVMTVSGKQMENVTVTGRKPFIQKLSDRIVVNVDNGIVNAGSSAMDVLQRSPGVNIDQNDNISLRGKSGVIIMIDGKPTAMTGTDLADYLKGLPSSAIERIDIITNPSAKYDAAGSAGIIDIRMKKDQRLGVNGTVTAGVGQGVYSRANGGGTFNYRNKKLNLFGNFNHAYQIELNHLVLDRSFFDNGTYNGGDLKDNYSKAPFNSNSSRLGMDFFPGKKTIIGFVVNGNFNHYQRESDNNSIVLDPQKLQSSTFNSTATNNDHFGNVVANLNFKHSFDSTGQDLTVDLDYGNYPLRSLTENATKYFKTDGSSLQPDYILDGKQKEKLDFRIAKADYTQPFKKGAKLETGVKFSYVSSDNDARFFDVSNGTPQEDVNKTNHFIYHENNNAAYLNVSKEFKKFDMQVGLRGEQTILNTHQQIGDVRFDSSYFQFFPSAFFNYKLGKEKTVGLSVSRRIDRPGYSALDPFLFLIDVSTYATGNPGLLPQLTWSYELSYTVKSLNFSLSYSHTKDVENFTLARFKDVFPSIPSAENVTVQFPINLASSDYFGITVAAPVRVTKWWNMVNNADVYYQNFKGNFSSTELNKGKPAADLTIDNSFTFKKEWSAELNGSLNTGGQYGFMVIHPQWAIGTGAQKIVMKSKGTIRFNITDIFWTNLPKAVVTYDNYIEKWHAFRETRVANLSFTYRFGNNKVQAARRRTTGSEEERQRAGN